MKRILSFTLCLMLTLTCLAGCGEKDRILYKSGLDDYVDSGEYKGLEIDTKSDEYKTAYDKTISSDVESHKLYEKKTSGKVAKGDSISIDFVGKKDGVAFDKGSAKDYEIVVGSSGFIAGFDDGLIGVEVGKTIDLNLTFPNDYHEESLKGQKVVFTVTINHIKTENPLTPDKYYGQLGYKNVKEYENDVKERTIKDMLFKKLKDSSKINDYPEEDLDLIYDSTKDMMMQSYGYTFESYLSQTGSTEEKFKEEFIPNYVKPMMDEQMLLYYVFDQADLNVTKNEINDEAQKIAEEAGNGVTADKVKEYYGEHYLEYYIVSEKALKYMYDNAKIS